MAHWTKSDALAQLPTPSYLIDTPALKRNLRIINTIKKETNCQVILALKGFACTAAFPIISEVLDGVSASSIYEIRLGAESPLTSIHTHMLGIKSKEWHLINQLSDHISFNSLAQYEQFKLKIKKPKASLGLRINPKVSRGTKAIYNPCAPSSRLGVPIDQVEKQHLKQLDGLHVHALCEQYSDDLEAVLQVIETTFGDALKYLKWMNWGGGHRISHPKYNTEHLISLIQYWQSKYNLLIILEPGEAIGYNCGYYIGQVLDIVSNDGQIAICDISATAHMPDVLEYPYRPNIIGSSKPNVLDHRYTIAGNTCLAGDIIGNYSFSTPLNIGDHLIFEDMGHYTLVKTTNFNGVYQPSIAMMDSSHTIQLVSESCYYNFKERLT